MYQNSYTPSVAFNGLQLNQTAVDEIDIKDVRNLKKSTLYPNTNLILGVGALANAGITILNHIFPEKFPVHPIYYDIFISFGVGVALVNYAIQDRKKQKEVDLLEFLKSGDPSKVRFKDTIENAEQTGLRIGPPNYRY